MSEIKGVEKVLNIIEGLGFKFKNRNEIQAFLQSRCLVQNNEGVITLYIDKIIVGKFTN